MGQSNTLIKKDEIVWDTPVSADILWDEPTPKPSMGDVAVNAIPKGVANVLNTPVALWNLAKQAASAMHPQIKEQATPTPNYPMQGMEALGLVDPAKNPQTPEQRVVDAMVQGGIGMAVPGGILRNMATGAAAAGAGQMTTELTGSPLAGAAVSMATPFAVRRLANTGAQAANAARDATLREGQQAGYVVPATEVNPSFLQNRLESVAGKAALKQEAVLRNQQVTNALAAKALGLPINKPITEGALRDLRKDAGRAYQDVHDLNPGGQLQRLQVRSNTMQSMQPGELQGMTVRSDISRPMEPGPVTGMRVSTTHGPAATTGLRVGEVRDAQGRLIGLKVGQNSMGVDAPLEGMKGKVTSRGQDVPGPMQGMQVSVGKTYGEKPGPLEGMQVSVKETRSGVPLEELRQARADANAYYNHYARSADPESLKKAKALTARAHEIEQEFADIAAKSGRADLVDELVKARQKIAKTYDVEKALNLATGDVSAPVIGRQLDQAGSAAKSGELETIGRFQQAFPKFTGEGAMSPVPGVSAVEPLAMAGLGMGGSGLGQAGWLAGGLPLVRGPMRSLLLSPAYQRFFAQPQYSGLTPQERVIQSLLAGRTQAGLTQE
jgi:hypothetical protein